MILPPRFRVRYVWVESIYGEQLKALSAELMGTWFAQHNHPPEILYHYTTADGLIGMLKTNKMWATHTSYLNDSSELVYAHHLILQHLQKYAETSNSDIVKDFCNDTLQAVASFHHGDSFYMACFCENGDLLSQWRGYGNRGGGYAIGFETAMIGLQWNTYPEFYLRKVIYDPELQNSLIESTLESTIRVLTELTETQDSERANMALMYVGNFLLDHLAEYFFTFKHPTFREEQEWRVVLHVSLLDRDQYLSQLQFRSASGTFIPYIELNLSPGVGPDNGRLPISRIVHGPTLHPELAQLSLEMMLQKYNRSRVGVYGSSVPLRL